jgi:hypothetical protein
MRRIGILFMAVAAAVTFAGCRAPDLDGHTSFDAPAARVSGGITVSN